MDLGWVDFDFDAPPSGPVAQPTAEFPSSKAKPGRQWNDPNHSPPNPGPRSPESPCSRKRGAPIIGFVFITIREEWEYKRVVFYTPNDRAGVRYRYLYNTS